MPCYINQSVVFAVTFEAWFGVCDSFRNCKTVRRQNCPNEIYIFSISIVGLVIYTNKQTINQTNKQTNKQKNKQAKIDGMKNIYYLSALRALSFNETSQELQMLSLFIEGSL